MPLKPTQVGVTSELKYFSLDSGKSEGSVAFMNFDVEGEMTQAEIRKELLLAKEQLDLLVSRMELAKGTLGREQYEQRARTIQDRYDSLLKRAKPSV